MRPDEFDALVRWGSKRRLVVIAWWASTMMAVVAATIFLMHAYETGSDLFYSDLPDKCGNGMIDSPKFPECSTKTAAEWDLGVFWEVFRPVLVLWILPALNAGLIAARRIPAWVAELPSKRERAKARRLESYETRSRAAEAEVRALDQRIKALMREKV